MSFQSTQIASPGFSPVCNGKKLQELMTELCVQEKAQAAASFANCPKSPKTKRARFTRTNSNDALKRSSSLSSFSTALVAIQTSEVESPESPAKSNAGTNKNLGKVKKQVRFSELSSMAIFRPPANAHEMYWAKGDKAKFKQEAVSMANHIHATLERQTSSAAKLASDKFVTPPGIKSAATSSVLPLLLALEKGNSIEPEEVIGLEDLIQGFEHVRNRDAQRRKTTRVVVRAWHHLKQQQRKKQEQGLICGDEIDGDEEAIRQIISSLYVKMSRKALLKARCHAAYVRGINRGVDSASCQSSTLTLSAMQQGRSGENGGRRMCRRAARAA